MNNKGTYIETNKNYMKSAEENSIYLLTGRKMRRLKKKLNKRANKLK